MFGPDLRDWIRRLEPARAVSFIRSLLIAEANRLQSPPEVIRMSGNVFAKDRGVDARSDLPMLLSAFPTGLRAWQVKTGATEPNYITEIAKDGVQQTLGEGRDYVLVWTNDPPDRIALEERIRDEVRKTHPDRTATLIQSKSSNGSREFILGWSKRIRDHIFLECLSPR